MGEMLWRSWNVHFNSLLGHLCDILLFKERLCLRVCYLCLWTFHFNWIAENKSRIYKCFWLCCAFDQSFLVCAFIDTHFYVWLSFPAIHLSCAFNFCKYQLLKQVKCIVSSAYYGLHSAQCTHRQTKNIFIVQYVWKLCTKFKHTRYVVIFVIIFIIYHLFAFKVND